MEGCCGHNIYDLVTELCEKFTLHPKRIKKLRSTAFEVLLKKRIVKMPKVSRLAKTQDAFLDVLSWQFTLANDYGLVDHGRQLTDVAEYVQKCYGDDVVRFLMCLRNVPKNNDDPFEMEFEVPGTLRRLLRIPETSSKDLLDSEEESRASSPDIWELASKEAYNPRKTWEDFGHPEPDKEKPFLSELGEKSELWVENLPSVYLDCVARETGVKPKVKSVEEFISDVKYLLVGMASYSFTYDDKNSLHLIPDVTVKGLCPSQLESFSEEFIFCGLCYKALHDISTPNPNTGEYKQEGYIFRELCGSIRRHLEFYRTAVMKLPPNLGLLALHERTHQLRSHLITLATVCKLGPYAESSESIPHGVSLLNYLYQTVLNLTDRNTLLVLYAVLFPCCQVYFSRFLRQWLLEGSINDPYDEFFIKPFLKYVSTRGRTYWTRSFSLREDRVPDFLQDLRMDILNCGKAMNLLRSCVKSSKLCLYLRGNKPPIITCCLTSEQLSRLQQSATSYFLEVSSECGPRINLEQIVRKQKELDPVFMNLIAGKRAATLKRIELERRKQMEEEREKKVDEMNSLKEQYDSALQQKQERIASEIEMEIRQIQFEISVEKLRDGLIEKEAKALIEYYQELYEISENRKKQIERHVENLRTFPNLEATSSVESFYSTDGTESKEEFHSTHSLDVFNANSGETQRDLETEIQKDAGENIPEVIEEIENEKEAVVEEEKSELGRLTVERFEQARKIKEKVLREEMGIDVDNSFVILHPRLIETDNAHQKTASSGDQPTLTEAQRNKLRVLGTEFGLRPILTNPFRSRGTTPQTEINRNAMLNSSVCFFGTSENSLDSYSNRVSNTKLDNENFLNRNFVDTKKTVESKAPGQSEKKLRKSVSLSLELPKFELDRPSPMSVDSTPLSEFPTTPATEVGSLPTTEGGSIPTTACTQATDDGGFDFEETSKTASDHLTSDFKATTVIPENPRRPVFSRRVTVEEASGLSANCLELFLHQSISIPVSTQSRLVNGELLRFYVQDMRYFDHLADLRNYFFLQDGEFGRSITENLFEKVYDANFPVDVINFRTLQGILMGALQNSSKFQENSKAVSFKINSVPKIFNLGDPDVLDCLSLSYKVNWPLNILLPADAIGKYDEVFKYLLKLSRISWVLKKIFLELKILAKEVGKKEIYLMTSPHYCRIHQCRHVMGHFIQTLQNYIVGEVLQPSWEIFERNLASVSDLDALYHLHTTYVKNILFLCLLNQKSTPLRKVIHKILVLILKFYDYLRSRSWRCEDGLYVHPNFEKLESIFFNFEEHVLYLFKYGRKVAKCGYQPHLAQLLDMMDINGYYSKKNKANNT